MLQLNETPVEILKLFISNGGTDIAKKVSTLLNGSTIIIEPCEMGGLIISKSFMFQITDGSIVISMGDGGIFDSKDSVSVPISENDIAALQRAIKKYGWLIPPLIFCKNTAY